jgi:TonB family protein
MISRPVSLMLAAGLAAAPAAAGAVVQAASPSPAPIVHRPGPPAPPGPPPILAPPARPFAGGVRLVDGPDWSDPSIYPAEALRAEQQGAVAFALLVGTDGRPRTCTIIESSGFSELDSGTCRLGMTMRFTRPAAETRTRLRVVWMLAPEEMPFEAQRMVATLDLHEGAVTGCTLDGSGAVVAQWARVACRTLELEREYYLGARRWGARRATVVVDLVPAGAAVPPQPAGRGQVTAVRRTAFTVDSAGDPGECRTLEDRGFGRPRIDHADACGFFLSRGFGFDAAPEDAAEPRRGTVEVRVMVEPAERPRH